MYLSNRNNDIDKHYMHKMSVILGINFRWINFVVDFMHGYNQTNIEFIM